MVQITKKKQESGTSFFSKWKYTSSNQWQKTIFPTFMFGLPTKLLDLPSLYMINRISILTKVKNVNCEKVMNKVSLKIH